VDSVSSAPSKVTVACRPLKLPRVFPSVFRTTRRILFRAELYSRSSELVRLEVVLGCSRPKRPVRSDGSSGACPVVCGPSHALAAVSIVTSVTQLDVPRSYRSTYPVRQLHPRTARHIASDNGADSQAADQMAARVEGHGDLRFGVVIDSPWSRGADSGTPPERHARSGSRWPARCGVRPPRTRDLSARPPTHRP
jgi:hypothetical protein